ncbi:MAG: 3'-5' exonuclease [Betaproteobacteria bacterium]|nr:3'-5' exonuclease [Betaproteobacteria bacterium]
MAWPVLVFDIETIPDADALRALGLAGASLNDADAVQAVQAQRKEAGQSDFLPHYLHKVAVISCVLRGAKGLKVRSFVNHGAPGEEAAAIQSFFDIVEQHQPQLVSWNGGGFDLPVLHYRALAHGVVASKYWDMGEDDRDYKWNNYISRYHTRHLDMMDLLALYQPRANAPLDALAKICGFPGKLGMDGSKVWDAYQAGGIDDIRRYCETDVMNTYLLYCRFQQFRGGFTVQEYRAEVDFVRSHLAAEHEPHWAQYLAAWPQPAA